MSAEGNAHKTGSDDGSESIEKVSKTLHMITDSELSDFIKNNAVKKFNVIENEDSSYSLVIKLTWKEGDYCLATTRKSRRDWASLDTLIGHLKKQGAVRNINIILFKSEVS